MNTFALRMQPLRVAALRTPAIRSAIVRQSILRRTRPFHSSKALARDKEHAQSAHTITQRLRTLKNIPPELIPLGVVILFALGAAAFAMGRKLVTDKTLRLSKSKKAASAEH